MRGGQRVLLTGASGFIGRNLLTLLADADCEIFVLVRSTAAAERATAIAANAKVVLGDVTDAAAVNAAVRAAQPDLCLHIAWYVVPGAYWNAVENISWVTATIQLLLACRGSGCRRFIGLGTCAEYDARVGYVSEDSPLRPSSLYAAAKVACWFLLQQLSFGTGVEVAWARLFYQFGPWEPVERLVPTVIRSLLAGRATDLTPGDQLRDYLYSADVAAALWTIAQSPLVGPVNVGSGEPTSVRSLARTAGRLLGREDLLRFGARPSPPGEPALLCANNGRLRAAGWRPERDLTAGLRETIRWWQGDHRSREERQHAN